MIHRSDRQRFLFVLCACGILALALISGLAGCGHVVSKETVEVRVPIRERAKPPPPLVAPLDLQRLPVFVYPTDPKATSGLTEEGERELKRLLLELFSRLQAWKAWAEEGPAP